MNSAKGMLAAVAALAVVGALGGCGGDEKSSEAKQSPSTSPSAVDLSTPTINDSFPVDSSGRRIALECWGTGSPTIVYDAGTDDSGIFVVTSNPGFRELAGRTRVCTYDRANFGGSDPAPNHRRLLDDVVGDLDALLDAAHVKPPYLLVGSSGGGFDVYQHAGRHPHDVVGLVMLDVPRGRNNFTSSEMPPFHVEEGSDNIDYRAVERQMALHRLPIPRIPVTVVTASHGQSAHPRSQRDWLEGSSHPRQVIVESGHNVFAENSPAVVRAIEQMLRLL